MSRHRGQAGSLLAPVLAGLVVLSVPAVVAPVLGPAPDDSAATEEGDGNHVIVDYQQPLAVLTETPTSTQPLAVMTETPTSTQPLAVMTETLPPAPTQTLSSTPTATPTPTPHPSPSGKAPANGTIFSNESSLRAQRGDVFWLAVRYDATTGDKDTEVYGIQFTLEFNATSLDASAVRKGTYLTSDGAESNVFASEVDNANGTVKYAEARRGTSDGVRGGAGVAVVRFNVSTDARHGETTGLNYTTVKVSDPDGRAVDTERQNGTVTIGSTSTATPTPTPTPTTQQPSVQSPFVTDVNNVGNPLNVTANASDEDRVVNVLLVWTNGSTVDETDCGTSRCTVNLSTVPGNATWNETSGEYEAISLAVVASDDDGGRTGESVTVRVHIAGDANGDGVVDIFDAVDVGNGWETTRGDEGYSDEADLTNDRQVDVFDAVQVGNNWEDWAESS